MCMSCFLEHTLVGGDFLMTCALYAARRALNPEVMDTGRSMETSPGSALTTTLAFTFLNPYVHLVTVVLAGCYSAQYEGVRRLAFAFGAALASSILVLWPVIWRAVAGAHFTKPRAWQVLDALIAVIKLNLSLSLFRSILLRLRSLTFWHTSN